MSIETYQTYTIEGLVKWCDQETPVLVRKLNPRLKYSTTVAFFVVMLGALFYQASHSFWGCKDDPSCYVCSLSIQGSEQYNSAEECSDLAEMIINLRLDGADISLSFANNLTGMAEAVEAMSRRIQNGNFSAACSPIDFPRNFTPDSGGSSSSGRGCQSTAHDIFGDFWQQSGDRYAVNQNYWFGDDYDVAADPATQQEWEDRHDEDAYDGRDNEHRYGQIEDNRFTGDARTVYQVAGDHYRASDRDAFLELVFYAGYSSRGESRLRCEYSYETDHAPCKYWVHAARMVSLQESFTGMCAGSAVHMIAFQCDDDYIKSVASQLLRLFREAKDLLRVNSLDQIVGLVPHASTQRLTALQRRQFQGVMLRLAEVIVALNLLDQGEEATIRQWEGEQPSTTTRSYMQTLGEFYDVPGYRHFLARTALPAHCATNACPDVRNSYCSSQPHPCLSEMCGGFMVDWVHPPTRLALNLSQADAPNQHHEAGHPSVCLDAPGAQPTLTFNIPKFQQVHPDDFFSVVFPTDTVYDKGHLVSSSAKFLRLTSSLDPLLPLPANLTATLSRNWGILESRHMARSSRLQANDPKVLPHTYKGQFAECCTSVSLTDRAATTFAFGGLATTLFGVVVAILFMPFNSQIIEWQQFQEGAEVAGTELTNRALG